MPAVATRKKRKNDNFDEIKVLIEECSKTVAQEFKKSNDLMADANEIEEKKLKVMENFTEANISFQKAIIDIFLRKNN